MVERRTFLLGLVVASPFAARKRRAAARSASTLDRETLKALGEVVLPAELGVGGLDAVVDGFARWLRGYRDGVELLHGYGTGELARTGPSPAPRWTAQLESLNREATRLGASRFASLSADQRRGLVDTALAHDALERMPALVDARHVAIGLVAYWAQSPAALDLCYGRRIGKQTCRPLAANRSRPDELEP